MDLALSPAGEPYLTAAPDQPSLPQATAHRIERAFEEGVGAGLLHLGAVEVHSELPPGLAYLRDLGRLFMTSLCAVPDLEEQRERVRVSAPRAELQALASRPPPIPGAEYVTEERLDALFQATLEALRAQLRGTKGSVQEHLRALHPTWSVVGRVCLHLAENRKDPQRPFAFLATYAHRVSQSAQVQHVPLGQALREYAGAGNKDRLLSLLTPVLRAAEHSALLKGLMDSKAIYHPLSWTPRDAYRFLKDIPLFEQWGLVVRVPDWWKRRPRPRVQVTVGQRPQGHLSMDALLDFDIQVVLGEQVLSAAELRQILESQHGLVLIRGQWVEIDRERLQQVLEQWQRFQRHAAQAGIPLADALRLLAGAGLDEGERALAADSGDWSEVRAGAYLEEVLRGLRDPASLTGGAELAAALGGALQATLRPYQEEGVRWLWFLSRLGLGACLADDMGLGKTIQVLALLLLLKRHGAAGPHLLIVPTSLLLNWKAEIDRFAPSLRVLIAHPSMIDGLAQLTAEQLAAYDLVISSYGYLLRLPALGEAQFGLVVLDEAQAIKNPAAKQTLQAKRLRSRQRLLLTGTPVENRLQDLWSLYDFICPGLLGSAKVFAGFARQLGEQGDYGPLRRLVRPYLLRRLKSDRRVIADLPDKTELSAYCALSKRQAALYQESVAALARDLAALKDEQDATRRRGLVLSYLLRFKQICNHPDQWLGGGGYEPEGSGKLLRLLELCEPIAARQEKVLVFTQFREMTEPLSGALQGTFGRPGLVLHGETPVARRKELVDAFQQEGSRSPPYFVLSLKAGGSGLNLTAASHVIHFDRWWNPAVENQATDRAYRIGQRRNVLVHKFVCRGTIEERIDRMIADKQGLSGEILQSGPNGEDLPLTEMTDADLLKLVALDIHSALGEGS